MLIRQHVCADGAGHQPADGAQRTTTHLVAQESTTGASNQRRSKATLSISRSSWPTRSARLPILAWLLVLALLRRIAVVAIALLRGGSILLLLGRVGRVTASWIMALTVVTGGTVALLGRIGRMRRWRVGTLAAR